jgi:putative transposase
MTNYQTALIPRHYYHLFNHSVEPELLFRNEENYFFFLRKLKEYITPVADTLCYNLLPNHYHLFLKVKSEDELINVHRIIQPTKQNELAIENMPSFVLQQISNFQNSYSKSYNKVFHRMGRLFIESVKRREIISENDYTKIIHYIHANAVHHGFCKRIEDWPHSSYHALIHSASTSIMRQEVLSWFGGREQFIQFHQQEVELKINDHEDLRGF